MASSTKIKNRAETALEKGGTGTDQGAIPPPPPPPPPSEADLEPTKRFALRIPNSYLAIAKLEWAFGGDRVQQICQELVESALLARDQEAHERGIAFANGRLDTVDDPLDSLPSIDTDDLGPVNVTLSRYATLIATKLAMDADGKGSIQKICEPLLCLELLPHTEGVIDQAHEMIEELQQIGKAFKRSKGSP